MLQMNQTEFDNLLNTIDWTDAYIKEAHIISPTHQLDDGSIVAFAAKPDARLLIIVPDEPQYAAVEFTLQRVSEINFAFSVEVELSGRLQDSRVELSLGDSDIVDIRAESLSYRLLHELDSQIMTMEKSGNN